MSNAVPHTDIRASSWLMRLLPVRARPYALMARLDRPIGWWLLLLPTWCGVAAAWAAGEAGTGGQAGQWLLARTGLEAGSTIGGFVALLPLMTLLWLGAVVMRGAGCTINDILDRKLDASVARTAGRPLPSGQVTVPAAVLFLLLQLLLGLNVLLRLPAEAIALALLFTPLIFLYPLAKRVTYFPQVVLGIVFTAGMPIGWAAASATIPALTGPGLACWLLYAGCILWCVGYDSIYAIQDREDDIGAGVKSTVVLFGRRVASLIFGCYSTAILLFAIALALLGGHWWALFLVAPVSAHLKLQLLKLDMDDHPGVLRLFKSNRNAGLLLLAMIIAAGIVARAN